MLNAVSLSSFSLQHVLWVMSRLTTEQLCVVQETGTRVRVGQN